MQNNKLSLTLLFLGFLTICYGLSIHGKSVQKIVAPIVDDKRIAALLDVFKGQVNKQPDFTQKNISSHAFEAEKSSEQISYQELESLEVMRDSTKQVQVKDFSSMFGHSRLAKTLSTPANADGKFLKVDILETDFKYPMIRVAERWEVDPTGNSEGRLIARSAMVADHLIVKWKLGADPIKMTEFLASIEAQVRDTDEDSRIMLISFDGIDPRAMGKMLSTFQKNSLVESVTPDYLASNNPDAN